MTYLSYWICDEILGHQTSRSEGTVILMCLLVFIFGFFFKICYCRVLSFIISPYYNDEAHQIKCGLWDPVCQTQTKSISSLNIHLPSFYFHLNPEAASEQECVCVCVYVCLLVELCTDVFVSSKAWLSFLPEEMMTFHCFHLFTLDVFLFGPRHWRKSHIFLFWSHHGVLLPRLKIK